METKEEFFIAVGKRINQLRKEKGYSFQELANRATIEKSNLVKITTEGRNITIGSLMLIAHGLGVAPKELLDVMP